jgi:hypothetical protein
MESENFTNVQPDNPKRLQQTISKLQKYQSDAIKREQQFYKDFSTPEHPISSAKEWEQVYLIGGSNERAKILEIINSRQMISILSTGQQGFDSIKKNFEKIIRNITDTEVPQVIWKDLEKRIANSVSDNMIDLFKEIGLGGVGTVKSQGKQVSNLQIQKILFKTLGGTLPKKSIGKGKSSKYLTELQQLLTKTEKNEIIRRDMAIDYLKQQLNYKGFSKNITSNVAKAFRIVLDENLQTGKENRLLSSAEFLVTGEVSEVGQVIAYMDFNNPFDSTKEGIASIRSKVTQYGRDTVQRAGIQGVKSKIDTIWQAPNGKQYYIQNKNSNAEMYQPFINSGVANELTDNPTFLPIQGSVTLFHLLQNFMTYNILTDDEVDTLIYLLINYNVLSKDYDKTSHERLAKGGQTIPTAVMTQSAIDQIFSKGIQYFLSDIESATPQELSNAITISNDFIIFMDRFLIPKSFIIKNLILFYQDYTNQVLRIQTTSQLTNFPASAYYSMVEEKMDIMMEERKKNNVVAYDYHNSDLVDAGANAGNLAANGIKINRINIKFNVKNLIEYGFI